MGFEVKKAGRQSGYIKFSAKNETQIQRLDHMLKQKGKLHSNVRFGP
jgi:hypothetical protein